MQPDSLARFLRSIPQSNESFVELSSLVRQGDDDLLYYYGFARFLELLGVIDFIDVDHVEIVKIRASAQTSKYALNSLAEYVQNDWQIVGDWSARGTELYTQALFGRGALFLRELEERRQGLSTSARPSRIVQVAQVIIKQGDPIGGMPQFLFQFDHNANRYQLIGGRHNEIKDEHSLLQTIIREIDEELPNNQLKCGVDYQLQLLAEDLILPPMISKTFGALTEYHFYMFLMTDLKTELHLGEDDIWIAIDDFAKFGVASEIYQAIESQTGILLADLPNSFTQHDN